MSGSDSDSSSISDWAVVNRVGEIEGSDDGAGGESSSSEFVNIDAELASYHRMSKEGSPSDNTRDDQDLIEDKEVEPSEDLESTLEKSAESTVDNVPVVETCSDSGERVVEENASEDSLDLPFPTLSSYKTEDEVDSCEPVIQLAEEEVEQEENVEDEMKVRGSTPPADKTEESPSPGSSFDIPDIDPVVSLSRETTDKESSPEVDEEAEGVDWTKETTSVASSLATSSSNIEASDNKKNEKVEEICPTFNEPTELVLDEEKLKSKDSDSDVVPVKEDDEEQFASSEDEDIVQPLPDVMQSSRSSVSSRFSFIQHQNRDDEESLPESDISLMNDSDAGNDDEIPVVNINKNRQYLHSPNPDLNWVLNIVLSLVVALALGLGIGHAIGSAREARNQEARVHLMTRDLHAKNLHDDLAICLKKQEIMEKELDDYRQGEIRQQINSLTSKLGWLEEERSWLRTELQNRSNQIDVLYLEKDSMQTQLKQLQSDTSQLTGKLTIMETQKQALQKENENLKVQVEQMRGQTDKSKHVENQVYKLQQDTASLNFRVEELGTEKNHLTSLNQKLLRDTQNFKSANEELLRQKMLLEEKDQYWKNYYEKMTLKVNDLEAEKTELRRQLHQKKVTSPDLNEIAEKNKIKPDVQTAGIEGSSIGPLSNQSHDNPVNNIKDEMNELRYENEHLRLELAKHRYGFSPGGSDNAEDKMADCKHLEAKIAKLQEELISANANCTFWQSCFAMTVAKQFEFFANMTQSEEFHAYVRSTGQAAEDFMKYFARGWGDVMNFTMSEAEKHWGASQSALASMQSYVSETWNNIKSSPDINKYFLKTKETVTEIGSKIVDTFGTIMSDLYDVAAGPGKLSRKERNDEKNKKTKESTKTESRRKNEKKQDGEKGAKKKTANTKNQNKKNLRYDAKEGRTVHNQHHKHKKFKVKGKKEGPDPTLEGIPNENYQKNSKMNEDKEDYFDRFKPSKILKKLKEKLRKLNKKKWFSMDFDNREDVWEEFVEFQQEHAEDLGKQDKTWLNCQMEWWKRVFHLGRMADDSCWEKLLPWQRHVLKKWKAKATSKKKQRTWKEKKADGVHSGKEEWVYSSESNVEPINDTADNQTSTEGETEDKINWYFQRAEDREDSRYEADWVFKRAKDRETMHKDQEHYMEDSLNRPKDLIFEEKRWKDDEYENDDLDWTEN